MSLEYRNDPYVFDLATAGSQKLKAPGHRIQIIADSSDLAAEINISVAGEDLKPSNTFPLKPNGYIEFPEQFREVLVSWPAQAGLQVTVLVVSMPIPPGRFDYSFGGADVIEAITQPVVVTGGRATENATVTVTTTATQVIPTDDNIVSWIYTNNGGTTQFLGGAGVTTANGWPLEPGASVADSARGGLWAIVAAGTENGRRIVTKVS